MKLEPYLLNELEADIAELFSKYRDVLDVEHVIEQHLRSARDKAGERYRQVRLDEIGALHAGRTECPPH